MLRSVNIGLHSNEEIKDFVNDMCRIEGETTLYSERSVIDAKSIIGIFSLDLTKPLRLEIED